MVWVGRDSTDWNESSCPPSRLRQNYWKQAPTNGHQLQQHIIRLPNALTWTRCTSGRRYDQIWTVMRISSTLLRMNLKSMQPILIFTEREPSIKLWVDYLILAEIPAYLSLPEFMILSCIGQCSLFNLISGWISWRLLMQLCTIQKGLFHQLLQDFIMVTNRGLAWRWDTERRWRQHTSFSKKQSEYVHFLYFS
jgi:hypothetical protein